MTDEQQVSTRLSFETDEDGITIYAIVIAEADGFEYSEEWLEKALVKEGYSGLTVSNKVHTELAGLVNDNHSGKVKLGKKIDAKVEAFLSGDLLTASLKVTAAKGGKRAGITEVMNALNDKEIELHLVNKKRIVGLVRKSRIVAPGEVVEVVVAKGLAPEHGKDTQFECLIEGVTDRQPHEREDGSLDYYDLGEILCIDEGCELMRKYPPEPAKIGRTVTGHEIPARIGKKINFKKCKGAIVSPVDQDLLISAIKGQPIISDKGISVDSVYTVKNVDLHTGHIDYDGSVVVKGDVASGMKIKSTGDVQVFGIVENASIEAGGNIDIKLGAVGHGDTPKNEEAMHINCLGNLTAAYLESAQINVQGDVLIKSRVSNCEINAGHQIIVGNHRQEKSGIVGGHVVAGVLIRAEVLGSSGCALTHVSIASSAEDMEKYDNIKQQIAEHDEQLISRLGGMVKLSKQHTKESKEELHQLKVETEKMKETISELINQKTEIEALMQKAGAGKVIAQKEAHQGVHIKILDQDQEIKSRYGAGTFLLFEGSMTHNSAVE